jgi:hypothetical protein
MAQSEAQRARVRLRALFVESVAAASLMVGLRGAEATAAVRKAKAARWSAICDLAGRRAARDESKILRELSERTANVLSSKVIEAVIAEVPYGS